MAFGTRVRDEDDEAPKGIVIRWSTLARAAKIGVGVGLFSVIAGSLLADVTTERGSGASKVAWFLSPSDKAAMQRAASAALTGDIPTGSIRLDPCKK